MMNYVYFQRPCGTFEELNEVFWYRPQPPRANYRTHNKAYKSKLKPIASKVGLTDARPASVCLSMFIISFAE